MLEWVEPAWSPQRCWAQTPKRFTVSCLYTSTTIIFARTSLQTTCTALLHFMVMLPPVTATFLHSTQNTLQTFQSPDILTVTFKMKFKNVETNAIKDSHMIRTMIQVVVFLFSAWLKKLQQQWNCLEILNIGFNFFGNQRRKLDSQTINLSKEVSWLCNLQTCKLLRFYSLNYQKKMYVWLSHWTSPCSTYRSDNENKSEAHIKWRYREIPASQAQMTWNELLEIEQLDPPK